MVSNQTVPKGAVCSGSTLFAHDRPQRYISGKKRKRIKLTFTLKSIGPRRDKTFFGVSDKRDSNQSPQLQRLARKLKFRW